jgi:hypothetical protein
MFLSSCIIFFSLEVMVPGQGGLSTEVLVPPVISLVMGRSALLAR